jgi:RimJ/RimL family protein N-acetyltransferase
LNLLYGHDAEVALWVARRIPFTQRRLARDPTIPPFGLCVAIGVLNSRRELVAGTVFHGYDPDCRSIEVSCAGTSRVWARPEIVRAILRYPFETAHCQRCTAVTPRKATSPRRFLEALGFKREGSIRRGFGDDNAIVYGLLAEEWAAHRLNRGLTDVEERLPRAAARA